MKVTIDLDIDAAKAYMASAGDKRVENLPLWVALSICLDAYIKESERWIPCRERMPEEPYGCLVTVEDEEPMTGQMFETILPYFVGWDGKQWNDSEGEQCPYEVIAWMPLPEPYKAESEEV